MAEGKTMSELLPCSRPAMGVEELVAVINSGLYLRLAGGYQLRTDGSPLGTGAGLSWPGCPDTVTWAAGLSAFRFLLV